MSTLSFQASPAQIMYSHLWKHIFEPEYKRLLDQVQDISTKNIARGANTRAMLIRGKVVAPQGWTRGIHAQPVAPDLEEELWGVYEQIKDFTDKRQYIKNCCSFLIPNDYYEPQNVRDSLSDFVANYVPEYQKLSRTRPEMYHILHKPNLIRQWEKANYLIEFYIGNLLVY